MKVAIIGTGYGKAGDVPPMESSTNDKSIAMQEGRMEIIQWAAMSGLRDELRSLSVALWRRRAV